MDPFDDPFHVPRRKFEIFREMKTIANSSSLSLSLSLSSSRDVTRHLHSSIPYYILYTVRSIANYSPRERNGLETLREKGGDGVPSGIETSLNSLSDFPE